MLGKTTEKQHANHPRHHSIRQVARTLTLLAGSTFALYLLAVPVIGGYLNWSMTAELRTALESTSTQNLGGTSIGRAGIGGSGSAYSPNSATMGLLREFLSLHGYRQLTYNYGIPQLPNGIYDLFLNAFLLSCVVTTVSATMLLPMALLAQWTKELPEEHSPEPIPQTTIAPTKREPARQKTDLIGTAIIHFLVTLVVIVLLVANRINNPASNMQTNGLQSAGLQSMVIESLFLLVQLPITAVIYPLSWMDSRQLQFSAAVGIIFANSVAASFCWHNMRALVRQRPDKKNDEIPPVFWGLAWILAAGTAFLAHRLPWDTFSAERRIWWFIVIYFLTAAGLLWLSLLLKSSPSSDRYSFFRAVTAFLLVALLAGTVEGSLKPIRIFLHSNDHSIESALLGSLKGQSELGNQFITVGELSPENIPEPRYRTSRSQSGQPPTAPLDLSIEPEVTSKCFFRAAELAALSESDAAKEISLAARMLQVQPAEVMKKLQTLRTDLRDAAPTHSVDLEAVKRFLQQQQHCALRKLTFFGSYAASALPIIEEFLGDSSMENPLLAEQAQLTVRALTQN